MTYYLTAGSIGIATERTPIADNGKVILTFLGEHADSVSVGGRHYPIIDRRAEIPTDAIGESTPLSAYALASHRRYTCEPLGRIGEGGTLLSVASGAEALLPRIAELLLTLSERLSAAEERLLFLDAAIMRKPITFGGI